MNRVVTAISVIGMICAFVLLPSWSSTDGEDVRSIHITWPNNYERPNEYTVLIASDDLTTPISEWTPILATTSGEAYVPMTNQPSRFFAIFNYDPDMDEQSGYGGSVQ